MGRVDLTAQGKGRPAWPRPARTSGEGALGTSGDHKRDLLSPRIPPPAPKPPPPDPSSPDPHVGPPYAWATARCQCRPRPAQTPRRGWRAGRAARTKARARPPPPRPPRLPRPPRSPAPPPALTGGSSSPLSRSLPHRMTNLAAPPARARPATSGVTRLPVATGGLLRAHARGGWRQRAAAILRARPRGRVPRGRCDGGDVCGGLSRWGFCALCPRHFLDPGIPRGQPAS